MLKKYLAMCFIALLCSATYADPSKLGTEFTPMGANPAANKNGTIPAWSGHIVGLPDGAFYESGQIHPDPYKKDEPILIITSKNVQYHKDKLTAGSLALFKKFPNTFKMKIYPTRRDFRYSKGIEARTKYNVGRARMVNIDGLQSYSGGAPFPMPKNGAEVIWNSRFNQPFIGVEALYDSIAVYKNGSHKRHRNEMVLESPLNYAAAQGELAKLADIDTAAYLFVRTLEPKTKKGEMIAVHEPVDQLNNPRKAWIYIPGAKRVKRAPDVGYDMPIGPGELMTADDMFGFAGAMDRYDWKLIGKREMYVPFHNYAFDFPKADYKDLLPGGHVNPKYMRYELHRCWIVEATLKKNARHVYAKRHFYIPEDSWLIAATDVYDGQGELWRAGFNNTLYNYFLQGYIMRAQVNYDFLENAYVALRLINGTKPVEYAAQPRGRKFFSKPTLQKMGRR